MPLAGRTGWGGIVGFGYYRAKYLLNWELPGFAFDPIDTKLEVTYAELGGLLDCRMGHLTLRGYATLPLGWSRFTITFHGDDASFIDEKSSIFHAGLTTGLEAAFRITDGLLLTSGYCRDFVLNRSPEFQVEEGVTLQGNYGTGRRIYVGIEVTTF